MKDGFIPVSQESCFVGPVVDYGFKGILDDLEERKAIAETLGQNNVKRISPIHSTCTVSNFIEIYFRLCY